MKILVITQKYNTNDSNLGVFIDWWNKLAEKVEMVYVLALEKRSEPTRTNVKVLSMGKEKGLSFFGKVFGFYTELFKTIGKTDVILVHMIPKYVILAAPIAFFYKKPIFMWYTGVSVHWKLRLAVLLCKKVFTAHEAAMRIKTKKRIIIGHGIDVNLFKIRNLKSEIRNVMILSAGRITPSKGHDLIIKVVADLIKNGHANLKLQIIGDVIQKWHEPYLQNLKNLAEESGISRQVEFKGAAAYQEMPAFLNNAEILINAVPYGGLDKVVLEAMASGVIPLTSNNAFKSIFPEEFSDNLIFKPNDGTDLKIKLKNILDNHLYQNEILCQNLRRVVVEKHNLNNLIKRIVMEIKQ